MPRARRRELEPPFLLALLLLLLCDDVRMLPTSCPYTVVSLAHAVPPDQLVVEGERLNRRKQINKILKI